jgi:spermidine synthase
VLVVDEGNLRYLRFGSPVGDDQSVISLSDPGAAPMECIRHALLGVLMTAQHRRALLIGLGGGSFSSLLLRAYAQLRVDAVEINPVVVAAARRFFGVKEGPRLHVHVADGATFVHRQASGAAYDIIMLDAYGEETEPPPKLITRAFYQRVRSRLAPGGVVILNLSVPTELERTLERRFRSVFQSCGCVRGRVDANQIVFCSDRPLPDGAELKRRAGKVPGLSFSLQQLVPRLQFDRCRSAEQDAQASPRTGGD